MMPRLIVCLLIAYLSQPAAAPFPQAEISTARIRATLYLPDAEKGYYRSTRFDWSGAIASLTWDGHNFFGQWFARHDPKIRDPTPGRVGDSLTTGAGLVYADAKPGERSVRMGVGAVIKPAEPQYRQFGTYEIADPGKWIISKGSDRI